MKEDLRTVRSKKMFKDAMLALLDKKDLYNISVKELCDKAVINRSTFYRHYDNVGDVLEDIVNDLTSLIQNANRQAEKEPVKVLFYIEDIIVFFDKHHEYDSLFSSSISLDIISRKAEEIVKTSLSRYISNDKSLFYLTKYLTHGTYSIISYWIENNRKESAKELSQYIFALSKNTVGIREE